MADSTTPVKSNFSLVVSRYSSYLAIALLLLTVLLFTSKSLYNYPVGLMAFLGLLSIPMYFRSNLRSEAVLVYVVIFLCLWIPLLVSLIDAVNVERSMRTAWSYLRFLFAGIFVLCAITSKASVERLKLALFVLVTFWCLDAVFQYLVGFNVLGYPADTRYVTGIFYPEITIGHISAVMSPFYFESLRKLSEKYRAWPWLLVVPLFVVVLLSGRRAAWVMLALSSIGYFIYFLRIGSVDRSALKKIILVALITGIALGFTISQNDLIQRRIQVAANLFSGDYQLANAAIGKRLDLWNTSMSIYSENWVNGVGPRGFRYVYRDFSGPTDHFYETAQTHPHQLVLEVLVETGTIGGIGLILFFAVVPLYLYRRKIFLPVFPVFLAMFVGVFPVNTHMAFYGSYWSSVIWFLLIILFLEINIQSQDPPRSTSQE